MGTASSPGKSRTFQRLCLRVALPLALARRMGVTEALEQQRFRAYNRTTLLAGVAEAASAGGVPDEDVLPAVRVMLDSVWAGLSAQSEAEPIEGTHPAVRAMLDSVWADLCLAEEAEARLSALASTSRPGYAIG